MKSGFVCTVHTVPSLVLAGSSISTGKEDAFYETEIPHEEFWETEKSSPGRKRNPSRRNEKNHDLHLLAGGFLLSSLKSSTLLPRRICQNWDASGVANWPFLGLTKDQLFPSKGREVAVTDKAGRQQWAASGSSLGKG